MASLERRGGGQDSQGKAQADWHDISYTIEVTNPVKAEA